MEGNLAISTYRLCKKYSPESVAVEDLDLRVPNGQVYGFLGRNGAGKTTTMRMLVGLVHPTSGTAAVLGDNPGSPDALARIGALIEAPAFYPQMSGRDNLRLLARYAGIPGAPVDKVLRLVSLADRGQDRYRTYSLGMKQRLGVAAALLKNPDLLLLDEPTNGLDPAGMAEIRTLIRTLARDGRTVLLSSHLLGEVEQICDRIGVIHEGRLIADGTISELRARSGRSGLLIHADPVQAAVTCLRTIPEVGSVTVGEDGELRVDADAAHAGRIGRELVLAGVTVAELRQARSSLEDLFMELTGTNTAGSATTYEADGT